MAPPEHGSKPRPGPVYDDAMKILAADDLGAVLSLVGVRTHGAHRLNGEFAGSRRVDLLADTGDELVHVEFVKDRSHDLDLRMIAAAELISEIDPSRSRSLLAAATILGSIVLSGSTIDAALRGAEMPIPTRETPFGRELLEEGRHEGEQTTRLRLTRLALHQRFGDDPRLDATAEQLATLPDEEWLARILDAATLDELT